MSAPPRRETSARVLTSRLVEARNFKHELLCREYVTVIDGAWCMIDPCAARLRRVPTRQTPIAEDVCVPEAQWHVSSIYSIT